jgi:hypothetical protein
MPPISREKFAELRKRAEVIEHAAPIGTPAGSLVSALAQVVEELIDLVEASQGLQQHDPAEFTQRHRPQ